MLLHKIHLEHLYGTYASLFSATDNLKYIKFIRLASQRHDMLSSFAGSKENSQFL